MNPIFCRSFTCKRHLLRALTALLSLLAVWTASPTASAHAPDASALMLPQGEDAGMEYIDRMLFFGESTTAHLISRGVLSDGAATRQVLRDASGTKRLSSRLLSETVIDAATGASVLPTELLAKRQPDYLVLSFGLNGIADFVSNKSLYVDNYNKLIRAVRAASPRTRILLQTVYPVTADCHTWKEDGATVSAHTRLLNGWLTEIAEMHDRVRVVDTASVLTDTDGCLRPEFDFCGDGIHLTKKAYEQILYYLRTHPWEDEAREVTE